MSKIREENRNISSCQHSTKPRAQSNPLDPRSGGILPPLECTRGGRMPPLRRQEAKH